MKWYAFKFQHSTQIIFHVGLNNIKEIRGADNVYIYIRPKGREREVYAGNPKDTDAE